MEVMTPEEIYIEREGGGGGGGDFDANLVVKCFDTLMLRPCLNVEI